jgi:AsmA protein
LRDDRDRSLTRIRDLELHSGALGAARPADLAFGARLDSGDGTAVTRVELHTRATFDAERSLATLAAFRLSGERIPAAATAKPVPFSIAAPQLMLDWKEGTLVPTTLELRLGELPVSVDIAGEQLFGARRLTGRVRMAEQSLRKLAASVGWSVPATRDPGAFARLAVSSGFRVSGNALALEDLDVTLDRSHLRGRVTVDGAATPAIDVDLNADTVDVDAYRPPVAQAPPATGSAAAVPLPFAALRALNARGTLALGRATVAGLTLSDVRLLFSALHGQLHAAPSAKAFGGTATGDVRLDASHEPATLALTADVRGVDIGAAVKAYAKSDRLSGRATAVVKLAGSGATDSALLASLAGPVDVDVRDGALEGLDVTYEIERAQALLRGQAPPARSGPARTPFSVLNSRSRLDRGIVTTDSLALETQVLKVSGKGTFRLADQAVDYQLTARVQEVPQAGAGAGLASLGSLEIPIAVTGTVRDYKVRPDLSGVVKGRVKQELEKHKDELREKLQEKLKDLFKN